MAISVAGVQTALSSSEISYDLVMEDEMPFVEGTYRLPDAEWKVFVFTRSEVADPIVTATTWHSGVTGLHIVFPTNRRLNQATVEQLLSTYLNVNSWRVVHGPDSIVLR